MPMSLMLILAVHVLSTLFWLLSSFIVAQAKGRGAERQYRPQMIAAVLAILSGAYLWHLLHEGGFGGVEAVLAMGAVCAVAAAGAQGMLVGGSLRRLRKGVLDEAAARRKITIGQRIAAGLLAVALLCMVGSRFA
jgi:hypothetical protein